MENQEPTAEQKAQAQAWRKAIEKMQSGSKTPYSPREFTDEKAAEAAHAAEEEEKQRDRPS